MEMSNVDIVAITNEYRKGTTFKLPAAIAWKRRINMDKLFKARALIEEAQNEARLPYLDDDHSTPTEDGGRQVLPAYITEYVKSQNEILAQSTDIDIKMIHIEDLGDVELSDTDMNTIAFMIEEGV